MTTRESAGLFETFSTAIREAIGRGAELDELARITAEFKDRGLEQRAAYHAIEALRSAADEPFEDRVLELMDLVAGFCPPCNCIWTGTLT